MDNYLSLQDNVKKPLWYDVKNNRGKNDFTIQMNYSSNSNNDISSIIKKGISLFWNRTYVKISSSAL